MCGIIGQVKFKNTGIPPPELKAISHRGPDGSGEWKNANGNVYFGHTRLAIIEPTPAGFQPMIGSAANCTITFNGEIYNHADLRAKLPNHKWNGNSDTETLLELLALQNMEILSSVKGMFAFAYYNAKDESVTLVRDRLGIKPLWIRKGNGYLNFASEIRALLDTEENPLSDSALSQYIGFGRMPGTGIIINSVESVLPGGGIKIFSTGKIEKFQWWPNPKFQNSHITNKHDAISLVKEMLTKAIQEHLISDVGVGSFLSGGIDSSIVTLVAGKALGSQLKTFTVGFPQGDFDERSIARQVAKQAGSSHYELEVTEEDCLKLVVEAVNSLDLPSVDAINTYIVSKAVHDTGLKVALSGLGGDELFGGYPSFKNIPLLDWLDYFPVGVSRSIVQLMPANVKEKLTGIPDFSVQNLTLSRRRFTSIEKLKSIGFNKFNEDISAAPLGLDEMGKISWTEIQGYMIPMLLRDSDQMSMAVGLEIRVPFLDHCLVEEVLSIPKKLKKGKGVKSLLVEAFKDELPLEVYNRPKQGFVLPMENWIRGPLKEFTDQGIKLASEITAFNEPIIQKNKFFNERSIHWTRIWKWSILGHWLNNQNISCTHSASKGIKQIA